MLLVLTCSGHGDAATCAVVEHVVQDEKHDKAMFLLVFKVVGKGLPA